MNHGFIADKLEPEHYVFGANNFDSMPLVQDGNWTNFLPQVEYQNKNGLETMNCTTFGTLNCIEVLFKRLFNLDVNYSDRFVGILAETTREGNSPHKAAETIRHNGLIDEMMLPFGSDIDIWDEYYAPVPMTANLLVQGQLWLNKYYLKHDWVSVNPKTFKKALEYSPLGVSVNLATQKDGIFYKELEDNHWVMLYNYKDGEYWEIFDHYDNTFKKIVWDYQFSLAKRFWISKAEPKKDWWFVDIFKRLLGMV